MKKLTLVMVFVLLSALFIGFNYLLLDKESKEKEIKNLEYTNASNNASMNAQKREIDSLVEENRSLEDKIKQLENEKEQLILGKDRLSSEALEHEKTLQDRANFINILKQSIDINILSKPVTELVEALSQAKYEEAYELEYAGVPAKDRMLSLTEYTEEMKNSIRKIQIDEIEIDKLKGSGNGEIFLKVKLNVKLTEDANKSFTHYTEGINEKYIKIDYSIEKKTFIISAINDM